MKKTTILTIALICLSCIGQFLGADDGKTGVGDLDAVSHASSVVEAYSLPKPVLLDGILKQRTVMAFSTVNDDGTPNIACISPQVVNADTLLVWGTGSRTASNIVKNKTASAVVLVHDDTVQNSNEAMRYKGGKFVLTYLDDKAEIARILSGLSSSAQSALKKSEGTYFLVKIVGVLPL